MISLSRFIYNIGTGLYFLGIRVAALFNQKAKKWVAGRSRLFSELEAAFAFQKKNPAPVFWMHCASLGEFEQGRPIIERFKKNRPDYKVLITFFSPSGYEIRKNYPLADWIFYLPADNHFNAIRFIESVRPSLAVFVKYEFWYHFLSQLKSRSIPTFLVAAVFRKNQPFFKWYGQLHRKMLDSFNAIFTQDTSSKSYLENIEVENVFIAGDPRIDRVISIANERKSFPELVRFIGENPVFVAGSTWKKDEVLLASLAIEKAFKNWRMVVVPHDVSKSRITEVRNIFDGKAVLHSELKNRVIDSNVLIVDSIGKLAWIYKFGNVAYIGGGHGLGIHNTLEPMAFNLPVIYGPRFQKFIEAKSMVKAGGHFPIRSFEELLSTFTNLKNQAFYENAVQRVEDYMKANKGGSETIISTLFKYL